MKIIDEAYGNGIPVAPRGNIVLFGALMIGFLIPLIILYLKFLLDNKIHSRKDIEDIVKILCWERFQLPKTPSFT
ncbi:hypothetical protein OKW96_04555 [Sphingobacterium sp. KU25419]|nr:hypothetical protein OKW96_04555 [Sphingobacterium sp. KU25419]